MEKVMKVSVKFTLDVDVEAWMREYGIDRSEVREDVHDLVSEAILQHLDNLGLLMPRKYG
jgi:hypothetical protein